MDWYITLITYMRCYANNQSIHNCSPIHRQFLILLSIYSLPLYNIIVFRINPVVTWWNMTRYDLLIIMFNYFKDKSLAVLVIFHSMVFLSYIFLSKQDSLPLPIHRRRFVKCCNSVNSQFAAVPVQLMVPNMRQWIT